MFATGLVFHADILLTRPELRLCRVAHLRGSTGAKNPLCELWVLLNGAEKSNSWIIHPHPPTAQSGCLFPTLLFSEQDKENQELGERGEG